jgi:glycosyltransferase involved in cell wall biosynthesis
MKELLASIVIPAHNEEAVIERTLSTLLRDAVPGEFEVIVVCNGCSDRTAELARSIFDEVTVLELEAASKTLALNAGISEAQGSHLLLLDADIELDTNAARALVEAVRQPGVEAAIGHMAIDTKGASWLVRAFYKTWLEHPYLRNGKFAAALALSSAALTRIGTLPAVTADDTYLRRRIPANRVAVVNDVRFLVRVPRTLQSLVRVRSRSYRGTRELAAHAPIGRIERSREVRGLARRVAVRPSLWMTAPVYLAVTLSARILARTGGPRGWERDLTTRTALPGRSN